jgi:hypothetical protein
MSAAIALASVRGSSGLRLKSSDCANSSRERQHKAGYAAVDGDDVLDHPCSPMHVSTVARPANSGETPTRRNTDRETSTLDATSSLR